VRPSIALALALCIGCGSSDDEASDDPSPTEPSGPSEQCLADAARIDAAYTRPEDSTLFRGVGPAPSASRGRELELPLPRITVTPERLAIDDVDVAGDAAPATLAAELQMRADFAESSEGTAHGGSGWANAVLLYATADTPIARLRDSIAELDPELRFDLVVQHSTSAAPEQAEPPPWLQAELTRLQMVPDVDARRERFRELFDRAAGDDCPQARAHTPFVFGRDPSVPATARPEETVAESIEACACEGVDVDALVAIGILTGPPNRRPLRRLPFRRVTEPGEDVVQLGPEVTVATLVDELVQRREISRVYFTPSR